jgi:hypothetical protein
MTAKEHHISRIVDGVTLIGAYSVKDGIVTVKSSFGSKATQVGDSYPYNLALIMLRELLDDARTGGPLPSSWLDCSSD